MHTMAGGAASGQEPSELLVESVKQENKELLSSVVPLHLAVLETVLLGRKSWENPLLPPHPTMYAWKRKSTRAEKSHSSRLALST